jgi:Protein of unknown function (DUF3024)
MAAALNISRKKLAQQEQAPPHPNAIDCKRIEKSLATRVRYRYVTPRVLAVENGYKIVSPCCSRNIDKTGGEIDIALVEFDAANAVWRLYHRDHQAQSWVPYGEYPKLHALLAPLMEDSARRFWQ